MKQMSTRGQNSIADWQLQIQNEADIKFGHESPSFEAVIDTLDSLGKVKNSKTHIELLEKLFNAISQESENKDGVSRRFQRLIDQIVSAVPDSQDKSSEDFEPSEQTIESESVVDSQQNDHKTSELVPEVENIDSEFVVEDGSSSNKKRLPKTKQDRQQKLNAAFRKTNTPGNIQLVRKLLEEYIKLDCRPLSKKNLSHSSFANMKKLWKQITSDSSLCAETEKTKQRQNQRKTRNMQQVVDQHKPINSPAPILSKSTPTSKSADTDILQVINSLKTPLQLKKTMQDRFKAKRSKLRALEVWSMFFTKNGKSKQSISNKITAKDKQIFKAASQVQQTQFVAKKIFQLEGLDSLSMPSLKLNSTDKLLSVSNQIASGKSLSDVIKKSIVPNHTPYEQQKQDIINSLKVMEDLTNEVDQHFRLNAAQKLFYETYRKNLDNVQIQTNNDSEADVDNRINRFMLENQTQLSFDQRLKHLEKIIEKSDSHEELRAQLQKMVLVDKYFNELGDLTKDDIIDSLTQKFTISESAPDFAITDFLNYVYNKLDGEVPRQINSALYEQIKAAFEETNPIVRELIVWLNPPSEQEAAAFRSLFPEILPQGFDFNKKLLSSQQLKIIQKNTENSRKDLIESQIRKLEQLKSARRMIIEDHSKISNFCRQKNLDNMQEVQQAVTFIQSMRYPDFGFNSYAVEILHKAQTHSFAIQQNDLTQAYLQKEKQKFDNLSQSTLATAKDFFVDIQKFPTGLREDFDQQRAYLQEKQQKSEMLREKLKKLNLTDQDREQITEELKILEMQAADHESDAMQSYLRLQEETEKEEQKLLAQTKVVAATQVGIMKKLTGSSETFARRTTEAEVALEALILTQRSVESVYAPLSSKAMNLVLNVSTFAKNYTSDVLSGVRYMPSFQQTILPSVTTLDKTNQLRRVLSMPNVGNTLTTPRDTDRCNYFRFDEDRVVRAASDRDLVQSNRENFFKTLSLPVLRASTIDFTALEAMKKITPDSFFSFASYVCVDCEEMMKFIIRHFLKAMRMPEPDSNWTTERYRSVCGNLMQSIEKGKSPVIPNPFYVGGKKTVYAGIELVGAWKDVPSFSASDVKYCISWWLEFDSLRTYLIENPVDYQTRQQLADLSEKMGLSEFDVENVPLKQTRIFKELIGTAALIFAITKKNQSLADATVQTFTKLISAVAARQVSPLMSYALIVANSFTQIKDFQMYSTSDMLFNVTQQVWISSRVFEIVISIAEFLAFTFNMTAQVNNIGWLQWGWGKLKDWKVFASRMVGWSEEEPSIVGPSQQIKIDLIVQRLILHVLSVVAPGLAVAYKEKLDQENFAFNLAFGTTSLGVLFLAPKLLGFSASGVAKKLLGFAVAQPFTNSDVGSSISQFMVNNAAAMNRQRMADFAVNMGLQATNQISKMQFSRVNQADIATQNLLQHIKDLKSKGVELSKYLKDADTMDRNKLLSILAMGTAYYLLNQYIGDIYSDDENNFLKMGQADFSKHSDKTSSIGEVYGDLFFSQPKFKFKLENKSWEKQDVLTNTNLNYLYRLNIFTPFRFFTEIATSSNLVDIIVTKIFVENFDMCSRVQGIARQRVCRQVLDTAKDLHRIKNTYYAMDSLSSKLSRYVVAQLEETEKNNNSRFI